MKTNTMKKLISLFLACLMLVSLGSLTTVAAEGDAKVDIISKNVHFGENYHPMFAVSTENLPDGAEVQLVLTLDGETVSTVKTVETVHGAECDVFTATKGVPAQSIDRLYVAKAQIVSGGEVIAESASYTYSILEYLNERLYVSENVTVEQKDLYEKFLAFAAAAEAVVDKTSNIASSVYVYNTTGTVDGTNAGGMYKAGDVIDALTSNVVVEDGKELTWTIQAYDANGAALAPLTVTDAELESYTVAEGSSRVIISSTTEEIVPPTPLTIPEALALADDSAVLVAGYVSEVGAWDTYYNNMSVTITDGTNSLYIFRLATKVELGDLITVTGTMNTYGGARQIAQGATAVITGAHSCDDFYADATCDTPKTCKICKATDGEALGHTEANENGCCDRCGQNLSVSYEKTTLSIIASTGSLVDKTITWANDFATVSNTQASSTTSIRTSDTDHYRVYKSSQLTVSANGNGKLKTVVFTATSSSYATALSNSITDSNLTVTVNGSVVTVEMAEEITSFTLTASAQFRISSVEITYAAG